MVIISEEPLKKAKRVQDQYCLENNEAFLKIEDTTVSNEVIEAEEQEKPVEEPESKLDCNKRKKYYEDENINPVLSKYKMPRVAGTTSISRPNSSKVKPKMMEYKNIAPIKYYFIL